MRPKEEIMKSIFTALEQTEPEYEVSLVLNHHTLEVLIDMRDFLEALSIQLNALSIYLDSKLK